MNGEGSGENDFRIAMVFAWRIPTPGRDAPSEDHGDSKIVCHKGSLHLIWFSSVAILLQGSDELD